MDGQDQVAKLLLYFCLDFHHRWNWINRKSGVVESECWGRRSVDTECWGRGSGEWESGSGAGRREREREVG